MRKIIGGLVAVTALIGGTTLLSSPAEAATDYRKCVTRGEYRAINEGMSQTRTRDILDGAGSLLTQRWFGYYEGAWVEGGYWDGYWDYQYNPETGYYEDVWVDEWVDETYWDDYADYEEISDVVRSYRTCNGWGTGRIGINLDNWTDSGSGMRVYEKGTRPGQMANRIDAMYDDLEWYYGEDYSSFSARSRAVQPTDLTEPKADLPGLDTKRPAKPESEPTTPAPGPTTPAPHAA